LDLNKFKSFTKDVTSHEIIGSQLVIQSDQKDPYMIYSETLDLNPYLKIDWCILLILFCVYWFIFSKTVGYLAKFKIFENHSRIDIIFLALFFGLLFIPMMHISNAQKSDQENRMLAIKPNLIQSGGIIDNNFGSKFNDWFNDRFWGRDMAVYLF
jgi:hypothetical protein